MYITCNVISVYRSGEAEPERKGWEIGLDFLIDFYDQAEETKTSKKRKHEEAARADAHLIDASERTLPEPDGKK